MPVDPIISTPSPGVYTVEATFGNIPKGLNSFSDLYVIGYSNQAGAPVDTPVFCSVVEDFINVFGSGSLSTAAINLFFAQRPGTGFYFINVKPRVVRTLTVPTVTTGATYSITIDSFTVSTVAVTGDTQATILARLATSLGTAAPNLGAIAGTNLRYTGTPTVTASANITLGAAGSAPAYPVAQDVIDSAKVAFDDEQLPQGFVIAPEFYQSFTTLAEVGILANGLESVVSDPKRYCIHFVDPMLATANSTNSALVITNTNNERNQITSQRGHSFYYFPYVRNSSNVLVPPSALVAGLALRTFRESGYRTPAGKELMVYGVTGLSCTVTDRIQDQLNPKGINCLRNFRREGVRVYGARSLSNNPFYTFFLVRLTLNILARTLSEALDTFVFRTIDGEAIALGLIKGTAIDVCEQLRRGGLLFGATAGDAYRVVCDSTNNTGVRLDNGQVRVKVVVKPSPTAEVVIVDLYRAALSAPLQENTTVETVTQDPNGTTQTKAGATN